jgi:chaperone modulatory protein CbpM
MTQNTLTGILLDERVELSLIELSWACSSSAESVVELVAEGVLEPTGQDQTQWRFSGPSLLTARTALRLQQDLNINLAGVSLALDLLEEIETLRERLCRFETAPPG